MRGARWADQDGQEFEVYSEASWADRRAWALTHSSSLFLSVSSGDMVAPTA